MKDLYTFLIPYSVGSSDVENFEQKIFPLSKTVNFPW